MKTIQNDGMMEVAKEIDQKTFNDGKRFTALLSDGRVIRCTLQDGAETIILNAGCNAHIEYKDNYVCAVADNDEVVGLAWPQN